MHTRGAIGPFRIPSERSCLCPSLYLRIRVRGQVSWFLFLSTNQKIQVFVYCVLWWCLLLVLVHLCFNPTGQQPVTVGCFGANADGLRQNYSKSWGKGTFQSLNGLGRRCLAELLSHFPHNSKCYLLNFPPGCWTANGSLAANTLLSFGDGAGDRTIFTSRRCFQLHISCTITPKSRHP